MDKDFQFLQELVNCTCGVRIHWVPNSKAGIQQLLTQLFRDDISAAKPEEPLLRTFRTVPVGYIHEVLSPLQLRYCVYHGDASDHFWVVGPCRDEIYGDREAAGNLRRQQLPEPKIRQLLQLCRQMPVLSSQKLYQLTSILVQRLTGICSPLPYRQLDASWQESDRREFLELSTFEDLSHIRTVEGRYEASAVLTEAVKQGNLSLAYSFIRKMATIPEDLTRNPNPLRNAQNLCIVLNTQLRHALEESGVSPYRLDQLSGNIGRQIEAFTSVSAVQAYMGDILRQYCSLAQEKEQQHLGSFSRLAVSYIKSHLTDNLTVKDAAKALLVNPDYLSNRFHKEVGTPFIVYVNQERIRQATALLRHTELQIQQIAAAVGYNNASYFTKQFLKFVGMTPRAYRQARNLPQW